MSKHVSRQSRWTRKGPNEHRSAVGWVYYRAAGQWHAAITYQISDPETPQPPATQSWVAANFKRARNAMMAVEDKARELQRRHGERVVFLAEGEA